MTSGRHGDSSPPGRKLRRRARRPRGLGSAARGDAGEAEILELLLAANPALDVFDAAAVGRTRGLEELLAADDGLAKGWSPDGFTPLHLAAFFGQEDAARLLLEHGADANVVARHESLKVAPLHQRRRRWSTRAS